MYTHTFRDTYRKIGKKEESTVRARPNMAPTLRYGKKKRKKKKEKDDRRTAIPLTVGDPLGHLRRVFDNQGLGHCEDRVGAK